MRALGVPSATAADSPPPETAYDDAVRKANHTDWAFTLYCVDSLDETLRRPDGQFAACSSAPSDPTRSRPGTTVALLAQSKRNGYGPGLFDGVVAHEIGHIFGALDEYKPPTAGYPARATCSRATSGSRTETRSRTARPTTSASCGAERKASTPTKACLTRAKPSLTAGSVPSTRGQIGWRDANGNGIPDVLDTTPTVKLKPATSSDGLTATVSGVASEKPCPPGGNPQGHAFSRGISIPLPHDLLFASTAAPGSRGRPSPRGSRGIQLHHRCAGGGPGSAATRPRDRRQPHDGHDGHEPRRGLGRRDPGHPGLTTATPTVALGARVKLTLHATAAGTSYPIGFLPGGPGRAPRRRSEGGHDRGCGMRRGQLRAALHGGVRALPTNRPPSLSSTRPRRLR